MHLAIGCGLPRLLHNSFMHAGANNPPGALKGVFCKNLKANCKFMSHIGFKGLSKGQWWLQLQVLCCSEHLQLTNNDYRHIVYVNTSSFMGKALYSIIHCLSGRMLSITTRIISLLCTHVHRQNYSKFKHGKQGKLETAILV